MNYNIRHLQPTANIKVVFAIMLSLFSIYLFLQGTMFGIILLGAAFKLSLREGFELNLEDKRYRKIHSLFAVNFGLWKNLPKIEYVSVFKTIKKSRARVITAEANLGFEVYKLNLFYKKNKRIEAYVSDDMLDAFQIAKHIAIALNIDILDATKSEKVWL
ncbi:MAG: hypothetical protein ACI83B_000512 [Sediminicola sp.]|jgi:hypothetical protein|tara:strand:- start:962 stop:1441 length:480 start_codon:yes stop_codon:yes gene_type:complete